VSACSTGAHSIGEAMRAIQRGDCDAMFAGGCERPSRRSAVAASSHARLCRTLNEEPTRRRGRSTAGADGFVIAEGAGGS